MSTRQLWTTEDRVSVDEQPCRGGVHPDVDKLNSDVCGTIINFNDEFFFRFRQPLPVALSVLVVGILKRPLVIGAHGHLLGTFTPASTELLLLGRSAF